MAQFKAEFKEEYDVFISHSRKDQNISRQIIQHLEQKQFSVYDYESGEDLGRPIIVNINAAILKSKKVVLLISKTFMRSDYFEFEFLEARMKESSTKKVVLIPILIDVEPESLPSHMVNIKGLKFEDSTEFYENLVKNIRAETKISEVLPAGDVGTGLAWSFYFGYLRLKLPTFQDQLKDTYESAEYQEKKLTDELKFKKLVILVPKSCKPPDDLTAFEGIEYFTNVRYCRNRAGTVKRDYSSRLFLLTNSETNEMLTAAVEFATPILSMHEMHEDPRTIFTEDQLRHQTTVFTIKLQEILLNDDQCKDNVFILPYEDNDELRDHTKTTLVNFICERIGINTDRLANHMAQLSVADSSN